MSANLTEEMEALLQTVWNQEAYPSYYDNAYCLQQNVSYSHRVNVEDNFNYCSVPLSGSDAFLFAAMALLVASVCMGKLQSVWVLVAGGILGILNYEVNLYRLGNAISLWLGIQPPDLFFYAFLPPLLVDAALRLDWYIFSKLWPHITLLAYGMVIINAAVLAPFILFVLGFSSRGWDWIHGAILAAMLAPTDAVAVTAILKAGGGPENMVVLMEGEALLNDASAVTLYTVFLHILIESSPDSLPSVPSEIWPIIKEILRLTGIGVGLGLAFAWALGYLLKLLRWRGARPYIESIVVLATAYLAFYVSQGPAKGSGVIAVCIFGLYGSATGHWGMLATDAESGIHEAVWDTVAFAANALIFFWSGISSVNFVRRAASQLETDAWNYAAIPIIFVFMYAFRFACMLAFNPIFKLLGAKLTLPEASFATVAGLRGALTLIIVADFVIHSDFYTGQPIDTANFDVVLWASAFVLLSLLINAPSIGAVMRWTGLSRISPDKVRSRRRAVEGLSAFTRESIEDLKQQQDGEFLQGANWTLVASFVDHTKRLQGFVPQPSAKGFFSLPAWLTACFRRGARATQPEAGEGKEGLEEPAAEVDRSTSGEAGKAAGGDDADPADFEVPFIARQGGLARHSTVPATEAARPSLEGAAQALNVAALRAAARGSFYDPSSNADAAGAAAAAAISGAATGVAGGMGPRRRSVRFGSGADVTAAGTLTKPLSQQASGVPSTTASGLADGEEEVELLYQRQDDGGTGGDFDAKWHSSLGRLSAKAAQPGAGPGSGSGEGEGEGQLAAEEAQAQLAAGSEAGRQASSAAAALVRRQVSSVAASRAAAAGAGSARDLLGRLQSPAREAGDAPAPPPASISSQQLSSALLSRAPSKGIAKQISRHIRYGETTIISDRDTADLEAGLRADGCPPDSSSPPDGDSPKAPGSSSEGGEGGDSLQEQRLRVLHAMKRHFRFKRMAGLLSPEGLRIATYACDKAIEMAEHNADQPLRLWEVLSKEISGTWITHSVAALLGATLRVHRGAPGWWQRATARPFRLFTGALRKHLGSKMLIACEATVELYMGLAASPQMQWVYFGEDGPSEVLREVQGELSGAYAFIQEREAEAPAQYRAVQSYRAAMAVLRQQRTFIADLYERGGVDEDEREALLAAVDAAMRHLDMTGPIWRPPAPKQVVRSLDAFSAAPQELTDMMLQHARLAEYKPGATIWSSADGGSQEGGGFFLVVSGVVLQEYTPSEGAPAQQLAGVGSMFGLLQGLAGSSLPGVERVEACGNSFGRGPLVYHFTPAAVQALRKRAEASSAGAADLEAELLRAAALHAVQHVQSDVQALVRSYLERHRPLTKYSAASYEQQQLPERVSRYTAQVLLDMLHAIPTAVVVRLRPGDSYRQGAHMLLLQGSLKSGSSDEVAAPMVLPWLTHNRFSFVAAVAAAQQQRPAWQAGPSGAILLVCGEASTGHSS